MTIALLTALVRHERRVRLFFSNTLAGGAFSSTTYYGVASVDGKATPPGVQRALVVASAGNVVELQLDGDLVQGAAYRFSAVGVPAADMSVTPDPSTADVTLATETRPAALGAHGAASVLERQLYGVDMIWNGADFVEGPDGDLLTQGGAPVVAHDLEARLLSDGLPWDPAAGIRPREVVDAPAQAIVQLRSRALDQVQLDDRVASATASIDDTDPSTPVLRVVPVLVRAGKAQGLAPIAIRTGPT